MCECVFVYVVMTMESYFIEISLKRKQKSLNRIGIVANIALITHNILTNYMYVYVKKILCFFMHDARINTNERRHLFDQTDNIAFGFCSLVSCLPPFSFYLNLFNFISIYLILFFWRKTSWK